MCLGAGLVVAAWMSLHSDPGNDPGSSSERVIVAERAWSEAFLRHDLETISRLLADDFLGIDGRGVVSDKAAELEEARRRPGATGSVLVGEQLSDIRVRLYGDTAVLTAINTARFSSRN